jgi:hypothetical protein
MKQNALTVIAPIRPERLDALTTLLKDIGNNLQNNPYIPFGKLATTHFCRWVIVPGQAGVYDWSLAFESNYDGTLPPYLAHLFAVAGPGLNVIYEHCQDFPHGGFATAADFARYFRRHMIPYAAFHMAYRGPRVQDIQNNSNIRAAIEQYLDTLTPGARPIADSRAALRRRILDRLHNLQEAGSLELHAAPVNQRPSIPGWVFVVAAVIFVLGTAAVSVPLLIIWAVLLRYHEKNDSAAPATPVTAASDVAVLETGGVQNQLTHLVPIKPGLFRLWTLKAVLAAINLLADWQYNQGQLGTISTIHFARWVFIDGNRRLLFFSNYDGSWESYLGDFIDKASPGLTAVWSNTVDFPPTRWLVFDGAVNEEQFKSWTRAHQIPTQVWYRAIPNETVQNILDDAHLRNGIEATLSDDALRDWLRLL